MNRHDPRAALPATGFPRKRTERLAQHLLRSAAHRAPPELAERLEEEWLADLAARRTALARLRLAIGCCWAASVIAREHGTRVAAASLRQCDDEGMAELIFEVTLGEMIPLTTTRIQPARGTVPLKCARNAPPARPGIAYRPALGVQRCRPLPTSATRAPVATPN